MSLNEYNYSFNLIHNFNKNVTNKILNLSKIKEFLNIDYCNKEYKVFLNKINLLFSNNQMNHFSNLINKEQQEDISNNQIISRYYIKLTHLFANIFNITTNNHLYIQNNKLIIPFDSFIIPELKYIYASDCDMSHNYILNETDTQLYKKHLTEFCDIFYKKNQENINNYFNINMNHVTNIPLNENKLIFDSDFNKYSYNLTILTQKIKNVHNKLIQMLNNSFIFEQDNDIIYIKNIISMELLDNIIENIRDLLIHYFDDIETIFTKTKYALKIFILNEMSETIKKRINI